MSPSVQSGPGKAKWDHNLNVSASEPGSKRPAPLPLLSVSRWKQAVFVYLLLLRDKSPAVISVLARARVDYTGMSTLVHTAASFFFMF